MADLKISQLNAITVLTPATDVLPVVDSGGVTKKITTNQILGSGGTATLASATITGDLTVDTSTLKVDSTNNRVGIGTASPALPLEIYKASGDSKMRITSGSNTLTFGWDDPNGFYYTASTSLMAWQLSGSTAMTLNASGLGVGDSPATKIFARVTPPGAGQDGMRVSDGTRLIQMSISGSSYSYQGIGSNQNVIYASGNPLSILSDAQNLRLGTSSTSYLLLDTSGNVGIGVTPSYKLDTQVAGGADRSILRAAVTGVSGGFQVKWDNATSKIHAIIENIPTSSAGLPSGTLWSDSGTIKIA